MCNTEEEPKEITRKLSFQKKKMLGYLIYKQIYTDVEISNRVMHISQSVKKVFRKPRVKEENIYLNDIADVRVKTEMDFWDTLYGVIFLFWGFFNAWWFLAAAIFLFCGYGKIIRIKKSDGSEFQIPVELKTDDTQTLLECCKK